MAQKKVERKKRQANPELENETKEDRFKRLANKRVNKVRKALDGIGQLGGPNYGSTEEQRKKIGEALQESLEFNLNRMNKVKISKTDFTL